MSEQSRNKHQKTPLNQLKVAAIQMVSTPDINENLDTAAELIQNAAKTGAKLVVLPEYFAIMAIKEKDKFAWVEPHQKGLVQTFLATQAKLNNLWLIGGTHPVQSEDPMRPYGRCYVFNPDGELVCWYDKIHLFDVDVNDSHRSYCESQYSKAGQQIQCFETPWGKIGLAVCYDLRFPELFRQLVQQQVNIFVLPAAFTYTTGKAHWQLLLRARAVENLAFMIASAQGGNHANGRQTYGHSCVIDPWGEVIASHETGVGIASATLDLKEQLKIRQAFPVLSHRKLKS